MIIPVIDIKNGEAVSGKSGKRETYTPLKTVFDNSSEPVAIARKLKKFGFSNLKSIECILREIEVKAKGTRPKTRMVGHTGYLTFARFL